VAFGLDGKAILTVSSDGTARHWEAATGRPLGPPWTHQGGFRAVVLSPDGKTVLISSRYGTARLRKVPTPVEGDVERIVTWVQVITGQELDTSGRVHGLDASTWYQRRQHLAELGGPPMP
jgi:WD40 repeat protein